MSDFIELEYKYNASKVKLTDFLNLMSKLETIKQHQISSWDFYYTDVNNDFIRYRQSPVDPELTIKRKVNSDNNRNRIEVDLPLNLNKVTLENITKFVELEGYKFNFKIFKSCWCFWLDNVNYVYYITYNEDMKELDRFIEVEVNKNKVEELNKNWVPYNKETGSEIALSVAAHNLKKLGLENKDRLDKSLFEMYSK